MGWKKTVLGGIEKLICGGGTSIRHSRVGIKFPLKMSLEFLDQINTKGFFQTKK